MLRNINKPSQRQPQQKFQLFLKITFLAHFNQLRFNMLDQILGIQPLQSMNKISHRNQYDLNVLTAQHSTHLDKNEHSRQALKQQLYTFLESLLESQDPRKDNKLEIVRLRIKLLESIHGLTAERVDNLQTIFLHYCTHIFKTGKHMTFQRLQYQKSHLTIDRFFVFLKDFKLTISMLDGMPVEIVERQDIVTLFKKISNNCKDLNFQQFICCLDKISILYYSSKQNYHQRQARKLRQRQKRKQHYLHSQLKKKHKRLANSQLTHQNDKRQDQNEKRENLQLEQENIDEGEEDLAKIQTKEQHENDDYLNELMSGSGVKDELEEVQKEVLEEVQKEVLRVESEACEVQDENYLALSYQQKVQYFYQLIGVDNAASFKAKMRELNLPIFQSHKLKDHFTKGKRNKSSLGVYATDLPSTTQIQPAMQPTIQPALQPTLQPAMQPAMQPTYLPDKQYDQQLLQDLRNKIEEKKDRAKNASPKISKEEYEFMKRKRKNYIEESIPPKKIIMKKRIEIEELDTDLSTLSKIAYDSINFKKFNPTKLFLQAEDDHVYLSEYALQELPIQKKQRVISMLESNHKNTQIILNKINQRTHQIQQRQQKNKTLIEHRSQSIIRKNKIVQKFMQAQFKNKP